MPVDTEEVAMTQPAPTPTVPSPGDPAPAPTEPTQQPEPGTPAPQPAEPADTPLGAAGKKALDAERARVKELERQMAELAPLRNLAATLAGSQAQPGGPSEVELLQQRFAEHEQQLAEERGARWRAEVAAAKGLTPQQAARLQGSTLDELVADADALAALFPVAPAGPRNPAPDPSQGARGGQPGPDLEARITELKSQGKHWEAVALERSKLQSIERPR